MRAVLDALIEMDTTLVEALEPVRGIGLPRDSRSRPASVRLRGHEQREGRDRTVITLAAFEDPRAGAGVTSQAEAHLLPGGEAPGTREVTLELLDVAGSGGLPIAWEGAASGRLLLGDESLDFFAHDGAKLTRRGDRLILEIVLGHDWVERDETPRELVASLAGVLILREGPDL